MPMSGKLWDEIDNCNDCQENEEPVNPKKTFQVPITGRSLQQYQNSGTIEPKIELSYIDLKLVNRTAKVTTLCEKHELVYKEEGN